ncbi:MAG: hypothetical protein RIB46_14340 [Pseudomonadales bacterium]
MDRYRPVFLLSLALASFLASCMFEPANETDLASTREVVTFRGVTTVPRATIRIEASPRAGGGYSTIATTIGDAAPFAWGGATLYEFEVTTAVPADRWTPNCTGQETFVRARGGALILTTYDSTNLAAADGETCIQDAIDNGQPFVFAARACASPASAIVRLTAAGSAAPTVNVSGNLQITSHLHAGDWGCLESVDGNLSVTDPYPVDIAFPSLANVTGDLLLRFGYEGNSSRLINAPSLTTVGGNVELMFIDNGFSGAPFFIAEFGLDALSSIGGGLTVVTDTIGSTAMSAGGLDSLLLIPGDLVIQANNGDNSWGGFAPNLAEVQGNAIVDLGFSVGSALNGIVAVGGDVDVRVNSWINGNGGFDNLVTVGGSFNSQGSFLFPDDYPALQSVGGDFSLASFTQMQFGANHFPVISSIGGVLTFRGMDTAIANFGSNAVQVGGITLDANTGLSDLTATLSAIDLSLTGPATFTDNSGISDCDAQEWIDAIAGYAGSVVISGNDAC